MTKKNKTVETKEEENPILNLDGETYHKDDLNQQQFYCVQQIKSCQLKAADLRFQLNQIKAAEDMFTQQLRKHLEEGASVVNTDKEESIPDENANAA